MFKIWSVICVASWEMPWSTGRQGPSPWRWRRVSTKGWGTQYSETHTNKHFLDGPKGWARENTQQGESTLPRGCYTWHSYVQDWLGDFVSDLVCSACMGVCLPVCEPLISTKHMLLNMGETAAQWFSFTICLSERQRERHSGACVCVCTVCTLLAFSKLSQEHLHHPDLYTFIM